MNPPKKRGRKPNPYTMWLCYELVCMVDEYDDFLPQHKAEGGGYRTVGKELNLSEHTVEYHVRNAQKQRDAPDGMRQYHDWATAREKKWWLYHAACIEKRSLNLLEYRERAVDSRLIFVEVTEDTLFVRPNELDLILAEAQQQQETSRGQCDYRSWLRCYLHRDDATKTKPLLYCSMSDESPSGQSFIERRVAKGLRNELRNTGRRRKDSSG
ncbi:hypothetical protein [Terriglobus sp. RCC_193]|uniref:hypothetical protein n=1 Tax=Terriglobus sp. RCC_193 TaxID=3239218 RepID=UPI00352589EB